MRSHKSLALLFPGQGSQKVGMGQTIYRGSPEARGIFQQADAALGFSLSQLCFEGPAETLTDTVNAQPALLTHSIALWRMVEPIGAPRPAWMIGHSLGHFTALVAAGALSFADGLRLVRERGRVMQMACQQSAGGMAAVLKLEAGPLAALCEQASQETGQYVGIANDNAPDQIVISGAQAALERAIELAKAAGAKRVLPLPVSGAFHSPLMAPAAELFGPAVAKVALRPPAIQVLSNVTAAPLEGVEQMRADMLAQLLQPVRWSESIRRLESAGVTRFVEVGVGAVLTGLVKRIAPAAEAWSLDEEGGLARLLAISGD